MTEPDKSFYVPGMMDLSAYRFEEVSPRSALWDALLECSPQASIFMDPDFVECFGAEIRTYACYKNKEFRAGLSFIPSTDKPGFAREFSIYNGILFGKLNQEQNEAQLISERFRITCAAADFLGKLERGFQMSVHPAFTDLRPFLWHGYGQSEVAKLNITLRYTSYLDLQDLDTENPEKFLSAMNSSRRQEIRKSVKAQENVRPSSDFDAFISLYEQNFLAQGQSCTPEYLASLARVMKTLQDAGKGQLFSCAREGSSDILSMAFFSRQQNTCCYLYGANGPDRVSSSAGTRIVYEALRHYALQGCTMADMEGVNSPKRGFFKLSFGGSIVPYYIVTRE